MNRINLSFALGLGLTVVISFFHGAAQISDVSLLIGLLAASLITGVAMSVSSESESE
ncbi:hypothetical protein [Dethiosulfatarculus sandiegensis]|uniref:Uncharacterized protein n=1 Tax=Dethiosulfatarculus sandiegensis TaxID=1429043 RepID=A0A0D2JEK4_9BACT|nr:hypothetical protein [Dethiosulfatarculus sandiegensis]KIX14066.1 hypothetical protein X474_10555 [Dethiosulfatarculus sandiegensis]